MRSKVVPGRTAVILVGHGGIPSDCPQELVVRLKRLESQRTARGEMPSQEEIELDRKIRNWPRTPETDPYQAGLERLGRHLQSLLKVDHFRVAYNEFCAPTLEEAVDDLIRNGSTEIKVVPSMLTPGGSHSEREVPEILEHLRNTYPDVQLKYAWPFDLEQVAEMLADHLERF